MAKPMQGEPGSAMHIHQSVVDADSGRNLFANPDGTDSALFMSHIAGLQKYLPYVMPLLAPNVNSYRRLVPNSDAPINVHWGRDNRTTGLRVPVSQPDARRVENRVAGADGLGADGAGAGVVVAHLGWPSGRVPADPGRRSRLRRTRS